MRGNCDNKEGDLNWAHPFPKVLGYKEIEWQYKGWEYKSSGVIGTIGAKLTKQIWSLGCWNLFGTYYNKNQTNKLNCNPILDYFCTMLHLDILDQIIISRAALHDTLALLIFMCQETYKTYVHALTWTCSWHSNP